MEQEILLRQNKDGLWEEYNPFTTIECETEEDFLELEKAIKHYKNHGHYVIDENGNAYCNKCKRIDDGASVHFYCPFCGAKMD